MKMPLGYLSPITSRIFGKSKPRGLGLHAWFCVDHRSDCKLRESEDRLHKVLICRLIVQNVMHSEILIDPSQLELAVQLKNGSCLAQKGQQRNVVMHVDNR
jgi:hypothetical protein